MLTPHNQTFAGFVARVFTVCACRCLRVQVFPEVLSFQVPIFIFVRLMVECGGLRSFHRSLEESRGLSFSLTSPHRRQVITSCLHSLASSLKSIWKKMGQRKSLNRQVSRCCARIIFQRDWRETAQSRTQSPRSCWSAPRGTWALGTRLETAVLGHRKKAGF